MISKTLRIPKHDTAVLYIIGGAHPSGVPSKRTPLRYSVSRYAVKI